MDENVIKDPLKRIEEIGVKEVSKATHIEPEYINYILDKNFEKLVSKNTKGFIKIIEREYGLDLQIWLDEYSAYRGENFIEDARAFSNPIIQNEIVIKDHKRFPSFFFWLIVFIVAVWAIYYFKLYENVTNLLTMDSNQSQATSYSNTTVVEKAENRLGSVGIKIPTTQELAEIANVDENSTVEDSNHTALNVLERTIMLENGASESKDGNLTIPTEKEVAVESDPMKASIVPAEKMWIGVIDVATGKKTTLTTDKEYRLNLEKEQLILTGHGFFEINSSGKKEQYKDKNPYRFHIKDKKISPISYDEFLKLNKGKAW